MVADLGRLRHVEAADVYVDRTPAARLRRTPAGTTFRYRGDYLASGGDPVATTLPVTDRTITTPAGALPPFFAGLLPEGRRLTAVRTATKTSADDELTLLLAVGTDTIGHACIVPADEPPADDDRDAPSLAAPSETSFTELLAEALDASTAATLDRAGLPGVQDKISGRMIAFPVRGSRGRYLLKLDPPEFPHLVHNEAFFLEAAKRSGLATAATEIIVDRDGRPGLLVERFDRIETPEGLVRLAQEDGCQVLDRYPADKYLLSAEEVVAGLAAVTGAPVVAARELLRQLAFAYLTGNGDAHAKNFSVHRVPSGEWHVTPAYDIPSSHPYGDTTMALTVAGRDREDITWRSFVALGAATGVREPAVRRMLAELVARVDRWVGDLPQLPFDRQRIHRLQRLIEDRRRKLTPPG